MPIITIILNKFIEFGQIKNGEVLRMKNFRNIFDEYPSITMKEFYGGIDKLVLEGFLIKKSIDVFEVTDLGEQLFQKM